MKPRGRVVTVALFGLIVLAFIGRLAGHTHPSSVPVLTNPSTSILPTTTVHHGTHTTTTLHHGTHTTTTIHHVTPRDPGLPNSLLTPGVTNANVAQSNIQSTICVSGFTRTIRPPESYTYNLKVSQLDSGYNYQGDLSTHDYEEDHLVPLEVGGSPSSEQNLWPEPWNVYWNAGAKDQLENTLHEMVCSGQISLASAQRVFMTNWIAGYQRYVGPTPS